MFFFSNLAQQFLVLERINIINHCHASFIFYKNITGTKINVQSKYLILEWGVKKTETCEILDIFLQCKMANEFSKVPGFTMMTSLVWFGFMAYQLFSVI